MVSVPVANPFDTAYVDFDPAEPNRLTGSLGHDGVVFIHVQSTGAGDAVSSSSGSGSLLYTGRHILTAAHVLPDDLSDLSQMGITFGSPEGRVTFSTADNQIEDIDIHPQWGGENNVGDGFDVAVITLADEARYGQIVTAFMQIVMKSVTLQLMLALADLQMVPMGLWRTQASLFVALAITMMPALNQINWVGVAHLWQMPSQ